MHEDALVAFFFNIYFTSKIDVLTARPFCQQVGHRPPGTPRRLKTPAEEKLARPKDKAYRNKAMWTIPYRLLPLALILPAIGCRIVGQTRRDGRTIRHIYC